MRIALFTDFFYPELGGIQDSVRLLAKGLAARGHEVVIYAPKYSAREYELAQVSQREVRIHKNVSIRRFQSLFSYNGSTGQSRFVLPSLVRTFVLTTLGKRKPDIIHTHSFSGIGLEAVLTARANAIPCVGTNHIALALMLPYVSKPAKGSVARYMYWYYQQCDVISAPAHSVFNELFRAIGSNTFSTPLHIISNPIDTEIFAPLNQKGKALAKKKLGFTGKTISFAGRLALEKRIDQLIKALPALRRTHPDIVLAIAGHGPEKESLERLAHKLGVEKSVRFMGTLSSKELAHLFNASDLFVTMSDSETQGMVTLQAMACGIPVVAARALATPEYVTDECGILVTPGDVGEYTRAVLSLLNDEGRRRGMSAMAHESIKEYSVAAIAKKWEDVYAGVLKHKRSWI